MKVTPIPYSAPMVLALIDGRKTQTRRIVKPQPPMTVERCANIALMPPLEDGTTHEARWMPGMLAVPRCPYGQAGDLLWVKEAWRTGEKLDGDSPKRIEERCREAGFEVGHELAGPIRYEADLRVHTWGDNDRGDFGDWGRYRHARFMPRWASRLTLRITSVRVERVQDISNEDAVAEGIGTPPDMRFAAHDNFRPLWDRINAARGFGWDANPWVWALSFEVIHANVDRVLATLGDAA